MDSEGPPSKKRRKGGQQQRLAAVTEENTEMSALHFLLMTLLAQGILSGALCHNIAVAAQKDFMKIKEGKHLPDLAKLAKLKHGKNFVTSVYGNLKNASNLPAPFSVQIPYSDGTYAGDILLPHEYFATMYEDPIFWKKTILGDERKLKTFWDNFETHPLMHNNPLKKVPNYKETVVPLLLHGDEVPVFGVGKIWSRSVLSFSWCSVIALALGGVTEDCMMYTWACFEKFILADSGRILGTMGTFWSVLKWSFECLLHGTWPSKDWRGIQYPPKSKEALRAGTPLAGGYRAYLVHLLGDLDYLHKYINIPQSTNHARPCPQCRTAFRGQRSWLDNRATSAWQNTLLTNSNWVQHWKSTCALFDLPGFSCWSVALDFMHNMYLGWLQFLYGSIMYVLVYDCLDGPELANLKTIEGFIKEFQKGDSSRQRYRPRLTKLSMFVKKSGFPKLKGRASDIRGLDAAMAACWDHYMEPTDPQHQQISVILNLNLQVRNLLDKYSPKMGYMALPQDVKNTVVTQQLQMAQVHSQLMDFYKEQNRQLFNLTTKMHFCHHTLAVADAIHPYLTWCFKGETKMRTVQRLWKSCLVGNKHWQVAQRAALKYRHLLSLRNQQ